MVGWFCCEPVLHHIANFVRMEGCFQLEKKDSCSYIFSSLMGGHWSKFYWLFSWDIIVSLKVLHFSVPVAVSRSLCQRKHKNTDTQYWVINKLRQFWDPYGQRSKLVRHLLTKSLTKAPFTPTKHGLKMENSKRKLEQKLLQIIQTKFNRLHSSSNQLSIVNSFYYTVYKDKKRKLCLIKH